MTLSVQPPTLVFLAENFADGGTINSIQWDYLTGAAEYIPASNGGDGTEFAPSLPVVSNGALQLTLQTYNPTSSPAGTSFQGSDLFTKESFSTQVSGIEFTAVAKLNSSVPGMDGGIFSYFFNSTTSLHNEIDSELLSDNVGGDNDLLTN